MGYVRHKYTKSYFLREDEQGNPTMFGADGADTYKHENGRPRDFDKRMLDQLNPEGRVVLDLGCGRGEAAKYLKELGAERVVAVDFSEDACELAKDLFDRNGLEVELHCEDALEFASAFAEHVGEDTRFDIVTMFDFVEHVPRAELADLFKLLLPRLAPRAVLLINTPAFPIDNDVLGEGLKDEARDSSDQFEQTFGMHCNRYTVESLKDFLAGFGLAPVDGSGHFFVQPDGADADPPTWAQLESAGFPVRPDPGYDDQYEYSHVIKFESPEPIPDRTPAWHTIRGGDLAGRSFHTADALEWQKEILDGRYDSFFFDAARELDLEGKLVIDVGAHIGYHSLVFASLVGPTGRVVSVEPNAANVERMKLILSHNADLAQRVQIEQVAAGSTEGVAEFHFSNDIDGGCSSGSFVTGGDLPYGHEYYDLMRFERTMLRVRTIDGIISQLEDTGPPAVVKIDVEGTELAVLKGAREIIEIYRPIFYVELHSIAATLGVLEFFASYGYDVEFMEEIAENRSFICAAYSQPDTKTPEEVLRRANRTIHQIVGRAISAIRSRDDELIANQIEHESGEDAPPKSPDAIELETQRAANARAQAAHRRQVLINAVEPLVRLADEHDPTAATDLDLHTLSPEELAATIESQVPRLRKAIEDSIARERLAQAFVREQAQRAIRKRLVAYLKKLARRG